MRKSSEARSSAAGRQLAHAIGARQACAKSNAPRYTAPRDRRRRARASGAASVRRPLRPRGSALRSTGRARRERRRRPRSPPRYDRARSAASTSTRRSQSPSCTTMCSARASRTIRKSGDDGIERIRRRPCRSSRSRPGSARLPAPRPARSRRPPARATTPFAKPPSHSLLHAVDRVARDRAVELEHRVELLARAATPAFGVGETVACATSARRASACRAAAGRTLLVHRANEVVRRRGVDEPPAALPAGIVAAARSGRCRPSALRSAPRARSRSDRRSRPRRPRAPRSARPTRARPRAAASSTGAGSPAGGESAALRPT